MSSPLSKLTETSVPPSRFGHVRESDSAEASSEAGFSPLPNFGPAGDCCFYSYIRRLCLSPLPTSSSSSSPSSSSSCSSATAAAFNSSSILSPSLTPLTPAASSPLLRGCDCRPPFPSWWRVKTLFLLSGAAGTLGDFCHARSGVLSYPTPVLLGRLAWWVPPEFGFGGVLLGTLYGPLHRLLQLVLENGASRQPKRQKKGRRGVQNERDDAEKTVHMPCDAKRHSERDQNSGAELGRTGVLAEHATREEALRGAFLFLLSYLLSSLLNARRWKDKHISAALASLSALSWSVNCRRSLPSLLLAVGIGALGVLWESSLCKFRIFAYRRPDFIRVRHWIFWLWFTATTGGAPWALYLEQRERDNEQGRGRQREQLVGLRKCMINQTIGTETKRNSAEQHAEIGAGARRDNPSDDEQVILINREDC